MDRDDDVGPEIDQARKTQGFTSLDKVGATRFELATSTSRIRQKAEFEIVLDPRIYAIAPTMLTLKSRVPLRSFSQALKNITVVTALVSNDSGVSQ